MTNPSWPARSPVSQLRSGFGVLSWREAAVEQLADAALFRRDCERLAALHDRFGLAFSLVLLRVRDAIHDRATLARTATRVVGRQLLEEVGPEDSVLELDDTTFAILLAGDAGPDALGFAEGIRIDASLHPGGAAGTAVFFDLAHGIAQWTADMTSPGDLLDAAETDLQARRRRPVAGADLAEWKSAGGA